MSIQVDVQISPFSFETGSAQVATIRISNRTLKEDVSDYDYEIQQTRGPLFLKGVIRGHRRADGVLALIKHILNQEESIRVTGE
jgi:hypothetical protein